MGRGMARIDALVGLFLQKNIYYIFAWDCRALDLMVWVVSSTAPFLCFLELNYEVSRPSFLCVYVKDIYNVSLWPIYKLHSNIQYTKTKHALWKPRISPVYFANAHVTDSSMYTVHLEIYPGNSKHMGGILVFPKKRENWKEKTPQQLWSVIYLLLF